MAEEENDTEELEEESGGSSKLVTILTIVNVLITAGIAGFIFMNFKNTQTHPRLDDMVTHEDEGHGDEKAEGGDGSGHEKNSAIENNTQHDFGKMVTLEQFTVNLATTGTVKPKFARVHISVEVPSEDTEMELGQKMPQVRNTVIDLFNSKRPIDLQNPEGRNLLKEQIQNALNSFLVTGKVRGVFFTSFAVSS